VSWRKRLPSDATDLRRRTGLTLPHQRLDEYGLEQTDNLFSSPKKPSPLKQVYTAEDADEEEGQTQSTAMTGMDSTPTSPSQTYYYAISAIVSLITLAADSWQAQASPQLRSFQLERAFVLPYRAPFHQESQASAARPEEVERCAIQLTRRTRLAKNMMLKDRRLSRAQLAFAKLRDDSRAQFGADLRFATSQRAMLRRRFPDEKQRSDQQTMFACLSRTSFSCRTKMKLMV
jgi:hypothetical protein